MTFDWLFSLLAFASTICPNCVPLLSKQCEISPLPLLIKSLANQVEENAWAKQVPLTQQTKSGWLQPATICWTNSLLYPQRTLWVKHPLSGIRHRCLGWSKIPRRSQLRESLRHQDIQVKSSCAFVETIGRTARGSCGFFSGTSPNSWKVHSSQASVHGKAHSRKLSLDVLSGFLCRV